MLRRPWLMTWDDLNQILAAHRLEPPSMRLSCDGETLLVGCYTTPVATRRHTVWHRLHPAELHARLLEGASLALDSVDELHPPIARLCEAIERELHTRVQANLYASWSATEGFGIHWDDHVRHEALSDRAGMEGPRRPAVAAAG